MSFMAHVLLSKQPMQARQTFQRVMAMATFLFGAMLFSQLPPRPPHPPHGPPQDRPRIEQRMTEIRKRLASSTISSAVVRDLKDFVELYLQKTELALNQDNLFQAGRFVEAADACRRPIDHLSHLENEAKPPPKPSKDEDDLRRVYFRLQLGNFFLEQIPNPKPKRLLQLAQTFYQEATKAHESQQDTVTGEYARAADDLTHALENLAQAYVSPQPPPPPHLPRQ